MVHGNSELRPLRSNDIPCLAQKVFKKRVDEIGF